MLEKEQAIHALIVKRVWYAGGKRYWIEERDSSVAVCHMAGNFGSKYTFLFAASPLLLNACKMVLENFRLKALARDTIEYAIRQTMPVP